MGLFQAQFFIYFLFLFVTTIVMKYWFRAVAASVKQESSAVCLAGISLLILLLYSGYTIPKPSMIGALRWISYINVSFHPFADSLWFF